MSRVLIVGDPHFKISNVQVVRRFIEWLHQMVLLHKPDFVVNLGDTFHTHNVIRSEVLALVADHVRWMADHVSEYFVLVGNHDMAHHKTPNIHAWLPFKGAFSRVIIVDSPIERADAAFFPYFDDPEAFNENFRRFSDKPLIFCHQTFIGADYGFVTSKDGAPLPTWGGQIISGHVHKEQRLGCVWYPGTPYAQESSDSNATKGIYVYDTVSRSAELLVSPLPRWVTSRVSPDKSIEAIQGMNPQDKNHLVLEGPAAEINSLLASRQFQELKRRVGFSVKKQPTDSAFSSKSLKKTSTLQDAVVEYVDRIYDGKVDKNVLKGKVLSALQ